ncbi:hypothetical protein MRB53_006085 [Persea americana]|uniref:Uncharacterized protein n=1 Tax=Persea americana TaxID=3435 RepID=A0ACC2MEZ1_PERAE|nr:hypothetical protein MRB53_006085 [Persea americana]
MHAAELISTETHPPSPISSASPSPLFSLYLPPSPLPFSVSLCTNATSNLLMLAPLPAGRTQHLRLPSQRAAAHSTAPTSQPQQHPTDHTASSFSAR